MSPHILLALLVLCGITIGFHIACAILEIKLSSRLSLTSRCVLTFDVLALILLLRHL